MGFRGSRLSSPVLRGKSLIEHLFGEPSTPDTGCSVRKTGARSTPGRRKVRGGAQTRCSINTGGEPRRRPNGPSNKTPARHANSTITATTTPTRPTTPTHRPAPPEVRTAPSQEFGNTGPPNSPFVLMARPVARSTTPTDTSTAHSSGCSGAGTACSGESCAIATCPNLPCKTVPAP